MNDINSYIDTISKAIIKGAMNACSKSAFLIEREAKLNTVPVDTGQLKNSIYTSIDRPRNEAYVSARKYWSVYVSFGTGIYNTLGVRRSNGWWYTVKDRRSKYYNGGRPVFTYGQKPNPFFDNAFNNQKSNIDKIIISEINKEISKLI